MPILRLRKLLVAAAVLTSLSTAALAATAVRVPLLRMSTSAVPVTTSAADTGVQSIEIDNLIDVDGTDLRSGGSTSGGKVINRSLAKGTGNMTKQGPATRATANPELVGGFDGVNLRQQRLANGGKQFTVEPPDQALCAGNGYVLESVNDVLRIFDGSGNPLTGVIDLNTFYGFAPAIDRSTLKYGPSITDPVCLFDKDTQRWFHVVLTLDHVGTTGNLSGKNYLDIAVSTSADPTQPWNIYRLPLHNNGTDGTPDHHCDAGYCLGDYPHIGADANGIYLTTNEFSLFGSGFYGAQIYAVSKQALVAGTVSALLFNTNDFATATTNPGFTVWPAQALSASAPGNTPNTAYLLSSDAVFNNSNTSSQILLWTIANTQTIDAASPNLTLQYKAIPTMTYGVPPAANQKAGDLPLRDCIGNRHHDGCSATLGVPTTQNQEYAVDTSDSRMQQVFYADGKLWAALGTAALINGDARQRTGIAYYILNPESGTMVKQGLLALPNTNLTYPSLAVTSSGRGVLGFTVVGPNDFPSAGYATIDAASGAGLVHIAKAGAGPADGFTGYLPYSDRPRWGDYGASATDGTSIWVASEYIAQTCTYEQYVAAPFASCGGTRVTLGNWATRISRINP